MGELFDHIGVHTARASSVATQTLPNVRIAAARAASGDKPRAM